MNRLVLVILSSLLLSQSTASADESVIEKCKINFAKEYPRTKVDEIISSPLPGICEIHSGVNVFYYYPPISSPSRLIIGGILTSDGKNLTDIARQKLVQKADSALLKKAENLPLDEAIKIGDGPLELIVFTDPDCPYCRKLEMFCNAPNISKDLTRYVFLTPLKIHPKAAKKSEWILEQPDPANALEKVMVARELDQAEIDVKDADLKKLKQHKDIAAEIGVKATPMIFVKDKGVIRGANLRLLAQYINNAHKDSEKSPVLIMGKK